MHVRKCKQCSKEFKQQRPLQYLCGWKCASKYAKKQQKAKNKRIDDMTKPYSRLMGEAKSVFQKWVRLRDKDKPCISCGKLEAEQFDGGHYRKAEIYRGLIFHQWNVHKQCSYCNRFLHGAEVEYRNGLIKRIGLENVELLELEAKQTQQKKWSREELVEIRDEYKQKIKLMK